MRKKWLSRIAVALKKNNKFKCNASKDINLDAYSNENLHMLGQSCRQALRKPMQVYMSAYKSAVNQWVEEAGLPDKNEEDGGPKVPYETFHREAVKNATLIYTDPRKHKTWSHKFKSIEADTEEELTAKSNAMFHRQVWIIELTKKDMFEVGVVVAD